MASPAFARARPLVVMSPTAGTAPPVVAGASTSGNLNATRADPIGAAYGGIRTGASDIWRGKLTLAALEFMILASIGWYIYTHDIQGGG